MKNKYRNAPLLSLLLIMLLSCGTDANNNEDEIQNGEFPISWPEGGEIMTEEWDGSTGFITLRYDNNQYETIIEFYDGYANGNGWNRSEIGQGEIPTVNYMNLAAGLNISGSPG